MKWPTGALDSIAILDRQSIHPSQAAAATPYLGLQHLDGDGGINCIQTVGSAGLKSNKFQFSDRHVLFGKLRPYLRKTAKPGFSGVCSTDIIPILPKDGVSRDYLFYFLRTPDTVNLATSRCSGANLPRLGPKQLASFQIPLPPLAEQKRIAGILAAVDALRVKRREALARLDTLLQSTFLDMFGDPVTNPMGWEIEGFDNWLVNIDSGWSPKCLNRKALIGEWGVLKLGAVTWCEFDDSDQKALPPSLAPRPELEVAPGDLLFTRKNTHDLVAAVAYVHKVRPRLMLSDLIFRLRLKSGIEIRPAFLWQLLIQPKQRQVIQRFAGGSAGSMPNISKAKLKTLKLIKPPLDLQHRFAAVVESVEQQKLSQRAHLAELDTLFASLQSRAFRGDL